MSRTGWDFDSYEYAMLLMSRRRRMTFGLPINILISLLSPDAMIHGLRASSRGRRVYSRPVLKIPSSALDVRVKISSPRRSFAASVYRLSVLDVGIGNHNILMNDILRIRIVPRNQSTLCLGVTRRGIGSVDGYYPFSITLVFW